MLVRLPSLRFLFWMNYGLIQWLLYLPAIKTYNAILYGQKERHH